MALTRRVLLTVVIALIVTGLLLLSGISSGLPLARSCHTTEQVW